MAQRNAMKMLALLAALSLAFVPNSPGTVSVVYAGSLVRVMEGPLAASLRTHTGLDFSGEGKGSKALAHLITAGLRTPDIFISADPGLIHGIAPCVVFGSARMVMAYSPASAQHALLDEVRLGHRSLLAALANPNLRVGRTDPALDPKGERTLTALHLLGMHFHEPQLARQVLQKSEIFPEEDLAVRVESGETDAGFFYSTETPGRGLRTIELPPDSNLSDSIAYAIAQLPNAPHPAAAAKFMNFVLNGPGRAILEEAGVRYFKSPRRISR